jgi:hypothetical protein
MCCILSCSCPWCTMCGWFPVGYFYRRSKNILRMSYVRTYRFPSDCIVASTGPTRHQHSTAPNIKRTCRDPRLGQRFGSSSTGWYTWPMTWFRWISRGNGLPWWLPVCVQFVLSFPAFFLSLALIDEVDPSLELTPLGHFTQKRRWAGRREPIPPEQGTLGICLLSLLTRAYSHRSKLFI